MTHTIHEKLQSLYDVILIERESAKSLDLEALQKATVLKEELLSQLDLEGELSQEDRKLAESIRFENRRNAYLLWAALNWIRESMEFFGRKSTPDSYNPTGSLVLNKNGGHLLSGRV